MLCGRMISALTERLHIGKLHRQNPRHYFLRTKKVKANHTARYSVIAAPADPPR